MPITNREPNTITWSEFYNMIEAHKAKPFTKRKFLREIVPAYAEEVPFVAGAVSYELGAAKREKDCRGLDETGVRKLLEVLHRDGFIHPHEALLPKRLGVPEDERAVVVGIVDGRSACRTVPRRESTVQEPPARGGWAKANPYLIEAVVKKTPLPVLISQLVSAKLRSAPLANPTVLRQMERLVVAGKITAEELFAYKQANGIAARQKKPAPKTPRDPAKGLLKSPWTDPQNELLVELLNKMDRKPRETGKVYFERVAREYNKDGRRKVTGQSCRKQGVVLVKKGLLSAERFNTLNRSRKEKYEVGSITPIEELALKNGAPPPSQPKAAASKDVVVELHGLKVVLTPEQQAQALENFLTPQVKKAAYEKFVSEKLT